MKILYDHQTFTLQKYGGISRYFYEIIKEFNKTEGLDINSSVLLSSNHYISNKEYIQHIKFLPNNEFRGKHRLINPINKVYSINKIKKQNFDIFHPTYYDPYFLKNIKNKQFVLTVYDMIHEKFPEMFSSKDKTTENKRLLVEKSSKIIAISENTKKDLIDYFGTDESKIEVVYLSNSMLPQMDIQVNIKTPKKFMLFVGSRGGYKNFNMFIKSVSAILNQDKWLFVACVGGGRFNNDEIQFFSELNIEKQVAQFSLNDANLAYFYQNALFFVFPSLYEGFGMPVLEAFACDCALVCSDVSSLPEIALDGACYFNPESENSIKGAVVKVLDNELFRKEIVKKGRKRLAGFSWKKTAKQTQTIYENVLS